MAVPGTQLKGPVLPGPGMIDEIPERFVCLSSVCLYIFDNTDFNADCVNVWVSIIVIRESSVGKSNFNKITIISAAIRH